MKSLAIIFLLLVAVHTYAQSPGVRNAYAMVYDQKAKALILFGGADEKEVLADTWMYKHAKWQKLDISGPPARTFPSMVYADGYILLFGGNSVLFGKENQIPSLYNDTWIFKNLRWQKVESRLSPDPRSEASIAYDPIRKKVVLFGGYRFSENGTGLERFGDTWEFDGLQWKKCASIGPLPRSGAVMIYDPASKKVLLLGETLT